MINRPATARLARALAAGVLLVTAAGAHAQDASTWPSRPITLVVPYTPGTGADILSRLLGPKMAERWKVPVVTDNRVGAAGTIGADYVAKAAPDGYTLLFTASTFTISPMTMANPPFDVVKDFAPVALVAKAPLAVAIGNQVPAKDIKGLIAHAKANPGKMTFAVGSIGSAGHLSTELIKKAGGIDYLVVPYKGTAPAYQDLVGGRIDGFVDPILGSQAYAKSGMLKVLAVTSKARVPSMPDVPTVGETIPGYEFYSWYGVWGPAKLPPDIAQKLNAEVNKALNSDMKQKLEAQGLLLTPGSIDDFAKFQRDDMALSRKIVTESHIKAE
jgi:tripartite-type tricarboxylate transporter receptor subunit TctC